MAQRAPPVLEACHWLGSSPWNELGCVLFSPRCQGWIWMQGWFFTANQ